VLINNKQTNKLTSNERQKTLLNAMGAQRNTEDVVPLQANRCTYIIHKPVQRAAITMTIAVIITAMM